VSDYIVGLTGGIGSGKTTVSDLFAELGITVADSDVVSRDIVMPGRPAHTAIKQHFGGSILLEDETLDRVKLREIVFSNSDERRWLESQTHGPIMKELGDIIAAATSPYAILVLSAGGGRSPLIDRMLVVDAPAEAQITRVTERDNNSVEQVQAIMNSQPNREERFTWADDILQNDGTLASLRGKVETLHATYLVEAAKLS
jgi:dephospho-CoA kinase